MLVYQLQGFLLPVLAGTIQCEEREKERGRERVCVTTWQSQVPNTNLHVYKTTTHM